MNARLAADLGRWERGELRADEVARLHPGPEASDLVQTHAWLSLQTSGSDEEPELSWEELEGRLDIDLDAEAERDRERETARRARRVPFVRLAVAFVAGALANPLSPAAQGFANVRDVARGVTETVVEEVTEVFDPIVPAANMGVVVLHPIEEQKLSVVSSRDAEVPAPAPVVSVVTSETPAPAVADAGAGDHETAPSDSTPSTSSTSSTDATDPTQPGGDGDGSNAPDATQPAPEPAPEPGDEEPSPDPPQASRGAGHRASSSGTPPGLARKPAHAGKGGLAAVAAVAAAGDGSVDHGPPSEPPGRGRGRR